MKPLKPGTYQAEPGSCYNSPKEIFGFRTPPQDGAPLEIAQAFLRANFSLLRLEPDLSGLRHQRTVTGLGATHVIMQQYVHDRPVDRAYVTVHLNNKGQVYLVKNRAMPRAMLPKPAKYRLSKIEAVQWASALLPGIPRPTTCLEAKRRWFAKERKLIAAWRIYLERRNPQEEWIVYVDGQDGGKLRCHQILKRATGRALIFDPSPVIALGDYKSLLREGDKPRRPPPEAYTSVMLYGLKPTGRLEGKRVTTSPTRMSRRVKRRNFDFRFRSHENGFEEVMVYYHIDQAVHYLEKLGYRNGRAIFRKPVRVNVNGSKQDNAWYSPGKRLLTYGTGQIDEAEDGETILHELGHAIQDAIIPGFGRSPQAKAIGEGFGDYFAASFFADKKPERYRTTVITWDGLLIGLSEDRRPPGLRRVDERFTFDDFRPRADEHANGMIWSATLWDLRRRLGRDIADHIVLDSHFQLDGYTTFARAARAMLDADQNLYGGIHHEIMIRVFGRRHLRWN
jgi:hypothetical protein